MNKVLSQVDIYCIINVQYQTHVFHNKDVQDWYTVGGDVEINNKEFNCCPEVGKVVQCLKLF